jgi:hypothetical protein
VSAFEKDPRFRRDYLAIDTYPDDYLRYTYGVLMHSGNFVRRDALPTAGDVERLRRSYQLEPPPDTQDPLASARALDAAGRPHEARVLWARAGGTDGRVLEAFDRLGDSRPVLALGDALDPELAAALRLRDTDGRPVEALALLDEVLLANASHYGARFQRARTLSLLNHSDARAAWTLVMTLASRIADRPTMALAGQALAAP